MKIIWLSWAIKSMDEIYDFFALKNIHSANHIYNKILERVEVLFSFPELGKSEPELSQDSLRNYRSLTILKGDYKIIYFIDNNIIHISFIWVCRKQPLYLIKNIQEMEKEYDLPEENPESGIGHSQNNIVREPAIEYGVQPEADTDTHLPLPEDFQRGVTKNELVKGIEQDLRKLYDE